MIAGVIAGQMRKAIVTSTAHKYWRINVTANNGATDFYTYITEFVLRDVLLGTNLAAGNNGISSTTYGAPNTPSAAFDGSLDTGFASATNAVLPQWLGAMLSSAKQVLQYTISAGDTATRLSRAPKDWQLQYSDDGSVWAVAHTIFNQINWTARETRTFTL